MSIAKAVRKRVGLMHAHHLAHRDARAINRAIHEAATPGMRDELISVAQRYDSFNPR